MTTQPEPALAIPRSRTATLELPLPPRALGLPETRALQARARALAEFRGAVARELVLQRDALDLVNSSQCIRLRIVLGSKGARKQGDRWFPHRRAQDRFLRLVRDAVCASRLIVPGERGVELVFVGFSADWGPGIRIEIEEA
jgi:hypothetical protein